MEDALVLRTKIDTKNFDKQIAYLESKIKSLEQEIARTNKEGQPTHTRKEIAKLSNDIEKAKNQLVGLYAQQNKINQSGFGRVQETVEGIGHSVQKVGKSIVRWGLTLIGVRSAMTLIRGSMNILSQYDEQLAKNMEYIRYVLAMALKPLIEYIVNLILTALQYINYIAQAWFGINLFANASAESMEKNAKNSAKLAKNIEKAKKDMYSFDKINKLTSQSSSGASGSSGTTPSVDLSKVLGDGQVPGWLKWLKDNKDDLLAVLAGISAFLLAEKLGMSTPTAIGLAAIAWALVEAMQELDTWYKEVKEDGGELEGHFDKLGNALAYLALAVVVFGAVLAAIPLALIGLWIMIIAWIVHFTDDIITSHEKIKKSWEAITYWFVENLGILGEAFAEWGNGIIEIFDGIFNGVLRGFSQLIGGIMLFIKGDFSNGVMQMTVGISNMIIGVLNTLISMLNVIWSPIRAIITAVEKVAGRDVSLSDIKIKPLQYVTAPTKQSVNAMATDAIYSTFDLLGLNRTATSQYPGLSSSNNLIKYPSLSSSTKRLSDLSSKYPSMGGSGDASTFAQEVGKNMSIKIDMTNEIDGRVLSNKLQEINAEDYFARNGSVE